MLLRRLTTLATTVALGFGLVSLQPCRPQPPPLRRDRSRGRPRRHVSAPAISRARSTPTAAISCRSARPTSPTPRTRCSACTRPGSARSRAQRAIAFLKTQLAEPAGLRRQGRSRRCSATSSWRRSPRDEDPTHFGGSGKPRTISSSACAPPCARPGPTPACSARPTRASTARSAKESRSAALAARRRRAVADRAVDHVARQPAVRERACGPHTGRTCRSRARRPIRRRSSGPDTNSTAMAVQGLAAYGSFPKSAARRRVRCATCRRPTAGTRSSRPPGQSSDPDSTALVIQALLAEKADPGTAVTALAQVPTRLLRPGRVAGRVLLPARSRTPNMFATVQAVPAAALTALPLAASTPSLAVPVTSCPRRRRPRRERGAHRPRPTTTGGHDEHRGSGTAGPCPGKTGVTVTVDFTAFELGEQTRCAPARSRRELPPCNTPDSSPRARVATASRSSAGSTTARRPRNRRA